MKKYSRNSRNKKFRSLIGKEKLDNLITKIATAKFTIRIMV